MECNDRQSFTKKSLTENWISILGFLLAVVFLIGEAVIIAADFVAGNDNAYVGILIYLVGPSILVLGLLLVPFGMWLEHRKRLKKLPSKELPVFDLNSPRHRTYLATFIVVSALFLGLSAIGTYKAYHVTESVQFCGVVCHQVMTPEYAAYQQSPHARVACVSCHIGPGAGWFVKSKLSGAWQVYAVLTNSYHLPIDTPIKNLRPARDTCEQCHWPEKFYESVEKSWTHYGSDDENIPYRVDMLLHVGRKPSDPKSLGKGMQGIHWHIGLDHKMEYYASDEDRQKIPWVRVTHQDGTVEEYVDSTVKDFDPAAIPANQIRVLDCIDCHNRPSHRFNSPFSAVNQAMSFGAINPKLPGIKAKIVELLQKSYKTTDEGLSTLETELRKTYSESAANDSAIRASVDQAIQQGKTIFSNNIFPEWGADWSHYPVQIGHFEFPGCYRCHDNNHKQIKSDRAISNDCELCHSIIRQGEGWDNIDKLEYKQQKFEHPRGYGDAWEGQNCHECHGPGAM